MKKFKKLLIVAVVAVMLIGAFALSGCVEKDTRPVLNVVTNAEFPPFESVNDSNKIVGFDVDFITAIGDKLGKRINLVNTDFDSVIAGISTGAYPLGIAGLTRDEEREKQMNFSSSYYKSAQVIIVDKNCTTYDGIVTKEALDDKIIEMIPSIKVNVASGQVGQYYAGGGGMGYDGYDGLKNSSNLKIYNSVITAVTALSSNDIAFSDIAVAKSIVAENPKCKMINVQLTDEEYAIGVNKKETELLTQVNKAIAELETEGKIQELKVKWGIA